jgi:hypothetical protein
MASLGHTKGIITDSNYSLYSCEKLEGNIAEICKNGDNEKTIVYGMDS